MKEKNANIITKAQENENKIKMATSKRSSSPVEDFNPLSDDQ